MFQIEVHTDVIITAYSHANFLSANLLIIKTLTMLIVYMIVCQLTAYQFTLGFNYSLPFGLIIMKFSMCMSH
jgi:hypothetical protein